RRAAGASRGIPSAAPGPARATERSARSRTGYRAARRGIRRRSGDAGLGRGLLGLARVALDDVTEGLVDRLHLRLLELHTGSLDVLGDLLRTRGPDERGRDVLVLEHPRDRELRHGQAGLVGDRLEALHAG